MNEFDITDKFIEELKIAFEEKTDNDPKTSKQLEYRVYYNDDGSIITYTTEDLPGNYLVITREQWSEARPDAKIISGKFVYTHFKLKVIKLAFKKDGKYSVSKWDVNILVDDIENIEKNNLDVAVYDIKK